MSPSDVCETGFRRVDHMDTIRRLLHARATNYHPNACAGLTIMLLGTY
ncbi:MAG TPA: hypothetical protein VEZ16_08035 [Microvirga sp.]|nr:hypothetical protein [Microvirga sp.]